MLLKKMFRTLWQYKAQFISMVIMVALGVGVFLGFHVEWYSLEVNTKEIYDATGFADFRIYNDKGFSEKDLEAVKAIPGVEDATRFLSLDVAVKDDTDTLALTVSENMNVSGVLLMAGEPYDEQDPDGFWLSDSYAAANGIGIGDQLTLTYQTITVQGTVKGLVKSSEYLICLPDSNQMMPDYSSYGYVYISPAMLDRAIPALYKMMIGSLYHQINVKSTLDKAAFVAAADQALGSTRLILSKDETVSWAEAQGEINEGKTMASILPVLFLAIAILTMVTTMHRIAANEKTQIGTLKALGFRDRRILRHYTGYGLFIGLVGTALGVALGWGICEMIMSENGMMGTYFDMPDWSNVMPAFVWPLLAVIVLVLTGISYLSVKHMLRGTAADALRPYTPKAMKKSVLEKIPLFAHLPFGSRWNLRDLMRHKSRSAMTLIGIIGCMLLLVGALGMQDTMNGFLDTLDSKISNYASKVNLSDNGKTAEAAALAETLNGDWEADEGINYNGETVTLQVFDAFHDKFRFVDKNNELTRITDEGAYLCQRLADTAAIGDVITFSPYGSEETYQVKVAGYIRSCMVKSIVITAACAEEIGVPYTINAIYTDADGADIPASSLVSSVQDQKMLMESYDSFMDIMQAMVLLLIVAAVVLGIVVLYTLGVMSYVERSRELATLKVLGFRDKKIGSLLISQNVWLTILGVAIGLPAGIAVVAVLLQALAGEYELYMVIGPMTVIFSVALTFGVSLAVGWMVARKNRKIDMVEALKSGE